MLPLLRPGDLAAQRLQLLAYGTRRIAFDLAIALDQRDTERRQHRAAAILAAGLRLDRRLPADAVDLVDQVPGALLGHLHRAAGGRNRSMLVDLLQKLDLARSDPAVPGIEIDAHAEGGKRLRTRFRH